MLGPPPVQASVCWGSVVHDTEFFTSSSPESRFFAAPEKIISSPLSFLKMPSLVFSFAGVIGSPLVVILFFSSEPTSLAKGSASVVVYSFSPCVQAEGDLLECLMMHPDDHSEVYLFLSSLNPGREEKREEGRNMRRGIYVNTCQFFCFIPKVSQE